MSEAITNLVNNFKLLVKKISYEKSEIDTKLSSKADKTTATTSTDGLMSSADKTKLDSIDEGAKKITIDSSLSEESENPVQNKVIYASLLNKSDIGHDHDGRYYTEEEIDSKVQTLQSSIDSLVGFVAQIVEELPPTGEDGVMYLVLTEGGGVEQDIYDEYIYTNGKFEKIGNTAVEVDLSGYATKEYLTIQLTSYVTSSALTEELNKKANTEHTHEIEDISNLQTNLDSKLNISNLAEEMNNVLEQMLLEE